MVSLTVSELGKLRNSTKATGKVGNAAEAILPFLEINE